MGGMPLQRILIWWLAMGKRVKFWDHVWCGDVSLRNSFPSIYSLACDKEASVSNYLQVSDGATIWDIRLQRDICDWEEEELLSLLARVYNTRGIGDWGTRCDGSWLN